jgi:hypothetical protein
MCLKPRLGWPEGAGGAKGREARAIVAGEGRGAGAATPHRRFSTPSAAGGRVARRNNRFSPLLWKSDSDEDIHAKRLPPSLQDEDDVAVKLKSNEVRIGHITRARAKLLKQQGNSLMNDTLIDENLYCLSPLTCV